MKVHYVLAVYADDDGTMPAERVQALARDADAIGADAPLRFVPGLSADEPGSVDQVWGLAIEVIA